MTEDRLNKTSDFVRGAWVNYNGVLCSYIECKETNVLIEIRETGEVINVDLQDIKGIPITDEIVKQSILKEAIAPFPISAISEGCFSAFSSKTEIAYFFPKERTVLVGDLRNTGVALQHTNVTFIHELQRIMTVNLFRSAPYVSNLKEG